jgi:hypothetical protein
MKRGVAAVRAQPVGTARLYRQPGSRDFLRLWQEQLFGRRPVR